MSSQSSDVAELVRRSAADPELRRQRLDLAQFAAQTFCRVGDELHVAGDIIGADRASGKSPFGHGSDETVGISLLLRMASQLISASAELFAGGRTYAGAALIRQLVEIEYLAWAFEARDGDAERWLRSNRSEREDFFRPAKLRKAAGGRFRSVDYSYHCELGGHPVPQGRVLLGQDGAAAAQLLLSDCLGHVGRIWDHVVGWARNQTNGTFVLSRHSEMLVRFKEWNASDPLVALPPPPPPADESSVHNDNRA